jgi:alpha-glucuronidase
VLSSADGRAWEVLASTDTPGTHQVSARLSRTGYVMVGVPPSAGGSQRDSRTRILLVGTGVAVVIVAAAFALRLRERSRPARPGRGRKR